MSKNKIKTLGKDFTEGDLVLPLLKFLTPFLLANILNSLYNTIDMMIIGQYAGNVGIVAVSQGGKMLNIFTMVSMSLSSAGQIIIGQQIGAKKHKEVSETIGTLFSLLMIIALVLSVLCMLFSKEIITLLQTPQESYYSALSYLRITSLGFVFTFGYNGVSAILRGIGESKMPLVFIGIATTVNIILDFVLIGIFNLGATGTAIATVVGQAVSLMFSTTYLYRNKEHFDFDFKLKSFKLKKDKLKMIVSIGLPRSLSALSIQGSQLIVISFVNQYGLLQAAVYSIGDKIVFLTNVVTMAVRQAGSTMVAQNLGAGKPNRVKTVVRWSLGLTMIFALMLAIPSILFPNQIFSMFTSDINTEKYASTIMMITAFTYFLAAMSGSFNTVTAGSGNARLNFLAGVLDGVFLRLGFGFLFGIYFHMEAVGFYLGHSLGRLAGVFIHGGYYLSGKWKTRKLFISNKEDN